MNRIISTIKKEAGIKWYSGLPLLAKEKYESIFYKKRKKENMDMFMDFISKRDELLKSVGKKELYEAIILAIKLEQRLTRGMLSRLEEGKERKETTTEKGATEQEKVFHDKADAILDPEKGLVDLEGNVLLNKEKSLEMLGFKGIMTAINFIKKEEEK